MRIFCDADAAFDDKAAFGRIFTLRLRVHNCVLTDIQCFCNAETAGDRKCAIVWVVAVHCAAYAHLFVHFQFAADVCVAAHGKIAVASVLKLFRATHVA